ncbi:efflux RND transporter periplasmic adaptor subunit [Marinobacterium jannaschii]|uniref:efflux RND transporter periplasmic adaptor subunit n=1 Tax=Marinobacterium jannaschii TaxID=64970 RepID=UPI000688AAC1|nr:efflux RND transporter periplasmic adaptor subunit [Marinobacterium jannaschii]
MNVRPSSIRPAATSYALPFALLLISTLTISGCDQVNGAQQADAAASVYHHMAEPLRLEQQQHYQVKRRLTGRVQVKQNAALGFEQAGKLNKLLVDEGDRVSQGSLLATQDDSLLQIERKELRAQLREVNARLELTDNNLKRIRSLKKRGFSSDQQLDELQAERKVQLASRLRTLAALDANQSRLDKTRLLAPFDGRISQRFIDQGVVVNAGASVFQLLQQGSAEVEVGVPIRMLDALNREDSYLKLAGQPLPLNILGQSPEIDPVTRTVQVRFALPPEAAAVNGQLVQLHLTESFQQPGYWIPLSAITDGIRGMWTVYRLTPAVFNSHETLYRLEQRNVRVLHATESQVYVSGALDAGEMILASGLHRLVPGQQVRIPSETPLALNTLPGVAP